MGYKFDNLDDVSVQSRAFLDAGRGILRITLLFGSAAIALALVIAPLADRGSKSVVDYAASRSIDTMSTGSIKKAGPSEYTVRRSVTQKSPNAVCILNSDGTKSGDC
ncbi:hypothetical protein HB779_01560 [Phyllobacterium sp. 628]|uniref:hypothetical protein n=1 Tax=Phyllobacterium sp. 628 TaxID=2718938 RepID=UPI0016622866|nr:hypothetical protein [Phyllobacterium sp. 628]QND50718.1 hypothetical protein HB779_01560 [Phyllobacterium sp. 628]